MSCITCNISQHLSGSVPFQYCMHAMILVMESKEAFGCIKPIPINIRSLCMLQKQTPKGEKAHAQIITYHVVSLAISLYVNRE